MDHLSTSMLISYLLLVMFPLPSSEAIRPMSMRNTKTPSLKGPHLVLNSPADHLRLDWVFKSVPSPGAGHKFPVVEATSDSVPSPGAGHKLLRIDGTLDSVPSPGAGHKLLGIDGILDSVPSPGAGHKFPGIDGTLDSVPSPGAGHKFPVVDATSDSVPSPGAGHKFPVDGRTLHSVPSPGAGHKYPGALLSVPTTRAGHWASDIDRDVEAARKPGGEDHVLGNVIDGVLRSVPSPGAGH